MATQIRKSLKFLKAPPQTGNFFIIWSKIIHKYETVRCVRKLTLFYVIIKNIKIHCLCDVSLLSVGGSQIYLQDKVNYDYDMNA